MAKRCFDILVALCGVLVLAPLAVVLGLAIKATSPGPVFFRQERVGRHGRLFRIHKFRTMQAAPGTGLLLTAGGDQRITAIGRILRRYKLDELPQLIDVLRGDMSLVGPRPEVPRYMAMYPDDARRKILSVRPGITDRASIEFRDEERLLAQSTDVERTYIETIMPIKQQYYLAYADHHTLMGDLCILGRTVCAVLAPRRAA